KRQMRIARDGKVTEIGPDILRPIEMKVAARYQAPQCVQYFHIDQVRGVQILVYFQAMKQGLIVRPAGQRGNEGRRIDDDHCRSRPDRTAATMASADAPPERALARASTSESGG